MSDERGGRREAGGARPAHRRLGEGGFDAAIDGAVREMLDVEPPPGLRGRVMDRIDAPVVSAFRRKGAWIFAPVAAAAVIALVVIAPWRDAAPPAGTTHAPTTIARNTPPVSPTVSGPPAHTPGTTQPPEPTATRRIATNDPPRARVAADRPDRLIDAAAAAAVEDVNFTAIAALAGPESIAIERLADPLPPSMRSIEPAALEIRALEVTALPETPRERREE